MTTDMDKRRWQTTVGRLGRERPSCHRPGAKSEGERRGSLTPQCPFTDTSAHWQRAAKNAARSVSAIAARSCITNCSLMPAAATIASVEGSPISSCRRRRGTAHPESFIPPVLRSSASGLPRKHKEMLVGMRQLHALDARTSTVQRVARHW
jgi:hypothetical protein